MFGGRKSSQLELPCPPTAQEILEDLDKAGPDDVVFTTEISADLEPSPHNFSLTKRFQVNKTTKNCLHNLLLIILIQLY